MDALLSYQFSVEVAGNGVPAMKGYFRELGSIGVEYNVIEHKVFNPETGWPVVQKIPGRLTYTPVTLRRGITTDLGFWQWHAVAAQHKLPVPRATVTVWMYDRGYKAKLKWVLKHAWPSKVSGPQWRTESNDIGIEELTLVYEEVTVTAES